MKMISILILLLLPLSTAQAAEDVAYAVPVEWQKVQLQQQIEDKINKSLSAVVANNLYVTNVEVTLTAARSFGIGKKSKGKKDQAFPLAKLGLNKNSSAYKKALASGVNSIFTRLGNVNVSLTVDSTVTPNQEAQARSFINQVVRSYTGKKPRLRISKTALNKNNSLTNDLKVAQVNVEAAKALAEAITNSNDKIAQAIAATQGVELPDENEAKAKKSKVDLPASWQEWVLTMKLPLGIVVATFLLLMGISGFKKFESQKVALMAQANAQSAEAAQAGDKDEAEVVEEKVEEEKSTDSTTLIAGGANGDSGFEQFRRMAEQYPETATYLLKLWLNMGTKEATEALAVLPKQIPVESLMSAFESLEDKLKSKLKKASSLVVDNNMVQRADAFVISQMVDTFLVNTIVLPEDVKMLLSDMSMEECVECFRRDANLGAAFINVLQTAQLGKLFSLLSDEEVNSMFESGLSFNAENVQYLADSLPPLLESLRQENQQVRVPLLDKAMDLISELGAEKEKQVFDMLATSGDSEQLLEATNKYFPSDLLLQLPSDNIKALLGRLPTKDRAILIYSRSKEEQNVFMTAIGETGRLREIINSEINEIEGNDRLKNQIAKDQSKIWNQFVTKSRDVIRKDSNVKAAADELLNQWLQEKGVSNSGGVDGAAAA